MSIKETPTNFRIYEKLFKDRIDSKLEEYNEKYKNLIAVENKNYDDVKNNIKTYKKAFNINLSDYTEFNSNQYIDGTFTKMTKRAFVKSSDSSSNYKYDLIRLVKLGKQLEQIHELKEKILLLSKCKNINIREYNRYLNTYFNKVHEKLILNGAGYRLGKTLGWICFNRCKLVNPKPTLDFAKTKAKRAKILEAGGKPFNKVESDFCENIGIEYNAEDYRVFKTDEYVYEIAWVYPTIKNGTKLKFTCSDYRHFKFRGKSNNQIAEEFNNNIEEIAKLNLDVKTKLNICLNINPKLYIKYIRNENQQPITTTKINRKNRQ